MVLSVSYSTSGESIRDSSPARARETVPLSSDTIMTAASERSVKPSPARCLVPKYWGMSVLEERGK